LPCLFKLVGRRISLANQTRPEKGRVRVLFTNWKIFRLFFAITLGYVASSMAYNGLHLNTLTVSGNQFLNFFLMTVIEIPAYLAAFVLMETRLGRRWTCSLSLMLSGVCLLLSALNFHSHFHAVLWSVIGKSLTAVAFNALYQLAVELYPTPLRNQGLSLGATLSNLQSIVLPQLVTIGSSGGGSENVTPIMLIGLICIVSGAVLTFVPETLNENLPQSIEDAECFADKRRYWSLAKSK
jgi:drug/metabolite transporter (DMT)-like permease